MGKAPLGGGPQPPAQTSSSLGAKQPRAWPGQSRQGEPAKSSVPYLRGGTAVHQYLFKTPKKPG